MAASALTLAKKTKALLLAHQDLVVADGTQEVPASFNFNFGGKLQEAGNNIRSFIGNISGNIRNAFYEADVNTYIPPADDESREAVNKRNQLFAYRAIHSLYNSANGLLKTKFQIRTYGVGEVNEAIGNNLSAFAPMEDCTAVLQFRRHDEDSNNPWVYSWIFTVEGVSITRGAKQPIHKFVSALLKIITLPVVSGVEVQAALAELAKMKGTAKPYYWFLTNQDITMWYQAIGKELSLTSCMSKPNDFYNHTGPRQHPMDCYNDSPDWRLMMLTDKSPEQIIQMCELAISNPSEATSLYKFPFVSRAMVLPTSKETSKNDMTTLAPYVMGKFYGNDKLVRFFYDDNTKSPYCNGNNGLLAGSYYIDGGRIQAIPSTREDETSKFLLPYFDKNNRARLVVEDGQAWWESQGKDFTGHREPIAKCAYEYGSARFEQFWSPACNAYHGINTFAPITFDTIFGPELDNFRDDYTEYTVNGSVQLVPESMFVRVGSRSVLRGEISILYDGTHAITHDVVADNERYLRVEGFGLFDVSNPTHLEVYTTLTNRAGEST